MHDVKDLSKSGLCQTLISRQFRLYSQRSLPLITGSHLTAIRPCIDDLAGTITKNIVPQVRDWWSFRQLL